MQPECGVHGNGTHLLFLFFVFPTTVLTLVLLFRVLLFVVFRRPACGRVCVVWAFSAAVFLATVSFVVPFRSDDQSLFSLLQRWTSIHVLQWSIQIRQCMQRWLHY